MARTERYQGILLDLRLPDVPGLAVLAALRAESISTPVLVLTGFGDFESARVAGQFGANGFEAKPLFIDELKVVVELLIEGKRPARPPATFTPVRSLATLLEAFHRLPRRPGQDSTADTGEHGGDIRRMLVELLIRALADPHLPMPAFLACATALRCTVGADQGEPPWALTAKAEELILEILEHPAPSDRRVVTAIEMVGAAAARHQRLAIERIAGEQNIDPAHLSRLIKTATGFDFTEWRTAFLLRPSLAPILDTAEHVKQIACRLLGFKHESQFDQEFRRFFGLAPTGFRQIWRTHLPGVDRPRTNC
jgi:AraC-like DNA-binding protein